MGSFLRRYIRERLQFSKVPMSAPTRQLGKLSIGGMPTTRAQTQRGASVPYETEPRSDSESEEETSSSDEEVPSQPIARVVRGSTNIPYDLGGLSPAARGRVMHGLKGEFVVDRCCATRRGFDFDVADHGRVGLNDGSLWLVDQLHRGFYPGLPPQAVRMSETGETQFFSRIAEMLGDKIEEIAKKRSWPYFPGVTSPADSSNGGPESMSRPQKARDILSAFSKSAMPDEFRPDLVETINQPRTPEQSCPQEREQDIFFDKIQARIRILFAEFDLYRETGAVRRDGTALEIPVVVEELKGRLDQIQRNILARSPHGSIGAAEALIHLLREVSTRNYDAFEDADWDRPVPAGEQEEERNLYLQLIDQSGHTDSFFVLDCLEILPDLVVRQWTPQLAAIFNAIHANGASLFILAQIAGIESWGIWSQRGLLRALPGNRQEENKINSVHLNTF
ncbi:hypothetical protein CISG_08757 [Coccidioides immitis RMSCC 3703]|uniref:Uncharacterized protein n=1 Tax=Coccidioides immitis RMSCC 3703 TaxID=454286 RepID=A0A0J8RA35_COCIT|nr:hypothetical protein CISG_08757 [Coccidioides immitis RMSCC 3703]